MKGEMSMTGTLASLIKGEAIGEVVVESRRLSLRVNKVAKSRRESMVIPSVSELAASNSAARSSMEQR
jgi:hypothetical protein